MQNISTFDKNFNFVNKQMTFDYNVEPLIIKDMKLTNPTVGDIKTSRTHLATSPDGPYLVNLDGKIYVGYDKHTVGNNPNEYILDVYKVYIITTDNNTCEQAVTSLYNKLSDEPIGDKDIRMLMRITLPLFVSDNNINKSEKLFEPKIEKAPEQVPDLESDDDEDMSDDDAKSITKSCYNTDNDESDDDMVDEESEDEESEDDVPVKTLIGQPGVPNIAAIKNEQVCPQIVCGTVPTSTSWGTKAPVQDYSESFNKIMVRLDQMENNFNTKLDQIQKHYQDELEKKVSALKGLSEIYNSC